MELKLEIDNDVIILKLIGNLVATSVGDLKTEISRLMEKKYLHILLDMSQMELIDSTGLGTCSFLSRELASKGGVMVFVGLNEHVRRTFHLTRFDQRVQLFNSRIDGVGALLAILGKENV
ncbi:MAG: STAS domain-containing protein [Desulfuromonadales bacterium]